MHRSVSARTWLICQVARSRSRVVSTASRECRRHPAVGRANRGGLGHGCQRQFCNGTVDGAGRRPARWPRSERQVARCSAERARRVLALAGGQRRLLRQLLAFDRGRWAAVIGLKTGSGACASTCARCRPVGTTRHAAASGSSPTISRTARLPSTGAPRSANRTPSRSVSKRLQAGVVPLGRGDLVLEQSPPVECEPGPVHGADLVRHGDVGVQIRVTGTRIAVRERGRYESGGLHLGRSTVAASGVAGVLLQPADRVGRRRRDGSLRSARRLPAGRLAHNADTLFTGENVRSIPGHRRRRRARGPSQKSRQLAVVRGCSSVLLGEHLHAPTL